LELSRVALAARFCLSPWDFPSWPSQGGAAHRPSKPTACAGRK